MTAQITNTSLENSKEERLFKLQEKIFSDYLKKTPNSFKLFEVAKKVMPGGVSGNLRYFEPHPLYMKSGQGSRVYDVDDNEYIDCFSANGPLLLGHNYPAIVDAVESIKNYGSLPLNPPIMVECAELIKQIIPCAEKVRFLNTGTEAVMTAVRYARAYTGKTKIIKFHGHYHGQNDEFLFGIDTTANMFSDGIPKNAISSMLIHVYNNIESVKRSLEEEDDIAAIILDPAMHSGGLWGSNKCYLEELRNLTKKHEVLLIFDEVITGFRMALGGAQEYFGVTPDLVTLAKALAAGEKLAVVAGIENVMNVVDPQNQLGTFGVFQSGTMNDGSVALASAIAAMKTYIKLDDQGEYKRLFKLTERLKTGIIDAFRKRAIGCQVNQVASMLQILISGEKLNFEKTQDLNMTGVQLFYHALIIEGTLLSLPTSNHIYLSFAHSDEDIDQILENIETVFGRYNLESALKN